MLEKKKDEEISTFSGSWLVFKTTVERFKIIKEGIFTLISGLLSNNTLWNTKEPSERHLNVNLCRVNKILKLRISL